MIDIASVQSVKAYSLQVNNTTYTTRLCTNIRKSTNIYFQSFLQEKKGYEDDHVVKEPQMTEEVSQNHFTFLLPVPHDLQVIK